MLSSNRSNPTTTTFARTPTRTTATTGRNGHLDAVRTDVQEKDAGYIAAVRSICEETGVSADLALKRLIYRRANLRSKPPQFRKALAIYQTLTRKHKAKPGPTRAAIESDAGGMVPLITCFLCPFVAVLRLALPHGFVFRFGFAQDGLMLKFATRIGAKLEKINAANRMAEDSEELEDLDALVFSLFNVHL